MHSCVPVWVALRTSTDVIACGSVVTYVVTHGCRRYACWQIVHLLNKGSEKISRYNLATCAIRVIQVLATSEVCVLAMVKANVVPVIVKSIRPPQRDAAFTLETLKIMLKTGASLALCRSWWR